MKITRIGIAFVGLASLAGLARADAKSEVVMWELPYFTATTKPGIQATILAIGDPVHETLTLVALRDAGVLPSAATRLDKSFHEFQRGVFWNDDPCGQLFLTTTSVKPSSGLGWWSDFHSADKEAAPKKFSKLTCKLLGRSHFGDLQFLHGMANGDGVPAEQTRALILAWTHFTYDVAIGAVKPSADLAKVVEMSALPSFNVATPKALFNTSNEPSLRERAIASLVHTIQDSYAKGHTLRTVNADGSFGDIEKFRSYANQDHDKHKRDDMWQGGSTDVEKIRKFRGGAEALAASRRVLEFYKAKDGWSEVEKYLVGGPFRLSGNTKPSGP